MVAKARLRTKLGCLTCRQRKKKCDELRPVCSGCSSRKSLECKWPTEHDNAQDRRLRKVTIRTTSLCTENIETSTEGTSDTSDSGYASTPEEQMTESQVMVLHKQSPSPKQWSEKDSPDVTVGFGWNNEPVMLAFYFKQMLPGFIHERSHPRFMECHYMCNLVQDSQPLRDTALACAAMTMSWKPSADPRWGIKMRRQALSYKTSALASLQDQIANGSVTGTEDWLLATANQLTLLDNRDHNTFASTSNTHIRAMLNLIKLRTTANLALLKAGLPLPEKCLSAHAFERVCYEAVLYHGATMMLFDREFDMLNGSAEWQMLEDYFRDSPVPSGANEENWPVLGMPFDVFRLVVIASRLSRIAILTTEKLEIAAAVLAELSSWYEVIPATGKFTSGHSYLVAANALLRTLVAQQPNGGLLLDDKHPADLEVAAVVSTIEIGHQFNKYPLWPLTVFYRLSSAPRERKILEHAISAALQNTDGDIARFAPRETINMFLMAPGLRSMLM